MKAQKMIDNLTKLIEQYGDLDLIVAKDDEGNGFNEINYEPTVGIFDGYDSFISKSEHDTTPEHFCIN